MGALLVGFWDESAAVQEVKLLMCEHPTLVLALSFSVLVAFGPGTGVFSVGTGGDGAGGVGAGAGGTGAGGAGPGGVGLGTVVVGFGTGSAGAGGVGPEDVVAGGTDVVVVSCGV